MNLLFGTKGLIVAGAVLLGGTGAVLAGRGVSKAKNADMHDFVQWKVEKTLAEIDATPEQSEKINAVVADLVARGEELHEGKDAIKETFKTEMQKDNPDTEKLHALIDSESAEFTEFLHEAVDSLVEIQQTLTPEQRAQVKEMIHDKASRHPHRGWHGR